MKGISNGSTQLPDFQRGWIWDDDRIRKLIASISNSYPIGAVMFLEYGGDGLRFKSRTFTNVDAIEKTPQVLVLDGQQRLTSVYCAMFNTKPVPTMLSSKRETVNRFYYFDIEKCLDPNIVRSEAIISVSTAKTKRKQGVGIYLDISTREKEFKASLFPINIIFDSIASDKWRDEYRDYQNREFGISASKSQELPATFNKDFYFLAFEQGLQTIFVFQSDCDICKIWQACGQIWSINIDV
jgi:uncharacterized protein with ParB-like and HNH nuclease domain